MTAAVRDRPVLTAWAATTPVGDDAGDVAAALLAGRDGLVPTPDLPVDRAGVVGLDLRGRLGRKGTRSLDRLTSLVMVTTGALLDAVPERDPDLGLVLGTTAGSTASITAFTRDTLTGARPYLVDPAAFPNTVLNSPAGHTAIRHRLTGPNTTVAGAELAGVHALRWADRAVRCGHARQLVVGAAEDLSPERAWGHRRLRGDDGARAAPVGEACALLLLEDAGSARAGGRPVLGRVTGSALALAGAGEDPGPLLVDCLRRAAAPGPVWAACTSAAPGPAAEAELTAVRAALGADPGRVLSPAGSVGDTGAATVAVQVVAVLAAAAADPADPAAGPRRAVLTAIGRDGAVGAVVLEVGP